MIAKKRKLPFASLTEYISWNLELGWFSRATIRKHRKVEAEGNKCDMNALSVDVPTDTLHITKVSSKWIAQIGVEAPI